MGSFSVWHWLVVLAFVVIPLGVTAGLVLLALKLNKKRR